MLIDKLYSKEQIDLAINLIKQSRYNTKDISEKSGIAYGYIYRLCVEHHVKLSQDEKYREHVGQVRNWKRVQKQIRKIYKSSIKTFKSKIKEVKKLEGKQLKKKGRPYQNNDNLIGVKFNHLTAIKYIRQTSNRRAVWLFECDCKNKTQKEIPLTSVKLGVIKSCGCLKDKLKYDILDKTFNNLTAIKRIPNKKGAKWLFKCFCGKEKIYRASHVVDGKIKSCGCPLKEIVKEVLILYSNGDSTKEILKKLDINRYKMRWIYSKYNLISNESKPKDYSGMKFGTLSVIKFAYLKNNIRFWECLCDCGKIKQISTYNLKDLKSCGRDCSAKKEDLINYKFNTWTVVNEISKDRYTISCSKCKQERIVPRSSIKSGDLKCKCLKIVKFKTEKSNRKRKKIDIDKLIELFESGKDTKEIAKELDCAELQVKYYTDKDYQKEIKNKSKKYLERHPFYMKLKSFTCVEYKQKNFKIINDNRDINSIITSRIKSFTQRKQMNTITVEQVLEKIGENPKCYLTGIPIDLNDTQSYQFDHIIPKSRGGQNTLDNLGICTTDINQMKRAKTNEELFKACKLLLEHNGYKVEKK